jgi:hypothetical protein
MLPVTESTYMGISKDLQAESILKYMIKFLIGHSCSLQSGPALLSLLEQTFFVITYRIVSDFSSISEISCKHCPCSCDFFSETRRNETGPKQARIVGDHSHVFSSQKFV